MEVMLLYDGLGGCVAIRWFGWLCCYTMVWVAVLLYNGLGDCVAIQWFGWLCCYTMVWVVVLL